jgi:hypothetical protein
MKVKSEVILVFIAALYVVLTFPLGLMGLTAAVAIAVFIVYNSLTYVLAILGLMIVARYLTILLKPDNISKLPGFNGGLLDGFKNKKEGFQPKDPVTIHQRIVNEKAKGPLNPKVEDVTGVLESAKILDSLQIANLNKAESGGSSSTLPASLNGLPPIRTPREEEIIKNTFNDLGPRGNPYLQNGTDDSSVNTALSSRGADLKIEQGAGDVPSTTVGHGSVE